MIDTAPAPVTSQRRIGWRRMRTWTLNQPVLQLAVLIALVVWLVIQIPAIANPRSITAILVIASLLALASMGQTLVVILGGLDLAIAGYITFGAFVVANLAGKWHWPLPAAVLFGVVVCGTIGGLVGFTCHKLQIQPLVMTLGVGAALTGATLFFANGDFTGTPPDALRGLTGIMNKTFGLPVPPIILIVLLLGIVLWLFLTRTAPGRQIYATGINVRAAELTRIKTSMVWTLVFATSGALAGIAGMFISAYGSGWSAAIGDPYLFSGLAAVIVGGTTFGSVRGSFTRTALGALILTALSTLIVSNGLAEAQSRIVYGAIILAVVALYGRERHVRDRF